MKTFGRVLIILTVFGIAMGLIYFTVNASGSSSADAQRFESRERSGPPNGQFEGRRERHEEGGGGIGLIFGMIKNSIIVAVIVAMLVLPKSLIKQQRRTAVVKINK